MAQRIATPWINQLQTHRDRVLAVPTLLDDDLLTPSQVLVELRAYWKRERPEPWLFLVITASVDPAPRHSSSLKSADFPTHCRHR